MRQTKISSIGLVDSHTHAVFSGDRVHEFIMKLEGSFHYIQIKTKKPLDFLGKSYIEIHEAGGGIGFTVFIYSFFD